MLRLARSFRYWLIKRRFEQFVRDYNAAEARAKSRGDTQAVHRAREAKRSAVHADLRGAR